MRCKKTASKPNGITGEEQKLGYKPEVTEEGELSLKGPGVRSSQVRGQTKKRNVIKTFTC